MAAKRKVPRRLPRNRRIATKRTPKAPALEFDHVFVGTGDFHGAWDFWTRVMGLEEHAKWGSPEYAGTVKLGSGSITMAAGEEGPYQELGYTVANGKPQLYLRTKDVDALHKQLAARGARIVREPVDTHYGARGFSVEGPDGLVIVIVQSR